MKKKSTEINMHVPESCSLRLLVFILPFVFVFVFLFVFSLSIFFTYVYVVLFLTSPINYYFNIHVDHYFNNNHNQDKDIHWIYTRYRVS
jgi:hypothetical protein